MKDQELFHELTYYTLAHLDKAYFIHQHAVDAFTAQTADDRTKPVGLAFSLAGLYLFLEKGYSGRQVQLAHMFMAKHKQQWPKFLLPAHRGMVTIAEVVQCTPGPERDAKIKDWCKSVWDAYQSAQVDVRKWADTELQKFFLS